jgi:excinuclease UvrABC nuclease subunit
MSNSGLPIPILTLKNLNDEDYIKSYRENLKSKGGVYCFINTVNNKKYIGSAKNLYLRLLEHLKSKIKYCFTKSI